MSAKLLVSHVEKMVKSLKIQVSKIQQLKRGIHIMRDEIHMQDEEHDFKMWLEEEGAYIRVHIPGNIIPDIAVIHKAWFEQYNKIYILFFNPKNVSFFGNKNRPKVLNTQEREKLEVYYEDLMEVHTSLVHKFDILHLRVESSREIDDEDIRHEEKLVI